MIALLVWMLTFVFIAVKMCGVFPHTWLVVFSPLVILYAVIFVLKAALFVLEKF